MMKKRIRLILSEWSIEFDKDWHESKANGHNSDYRDLLGEFIERLDALEFSLRKKWWQR